MWVVTEREAAAMYARASLKWYGPRARSVAGSMISKMAEQGDLKGVRIWRLISEQLPEAQQQQASVSEPRRLEA
jgi:hypothetical protein